MKLQLRGTPGVFISVEKYFANEVKKFIEDIEDFDGENKENENVVERFKHWINEDRDFVIVNDNGDGIEELTIEEDDYYDSCYNAAIEEIKKHFNI